MRAILTAVCISFAASTTSYAQNATAQATIDIKAEEATIRAAAAKQVDSTSYTPDAIFWSGAYARPIIGRANARSATPLDSARMRQRRNTQRSENIVRLEVAASGDMAYDFSDFTLSYDLADTGQHVSFQGSALRVWKKVGGQWRIAAWFVKPYEQPR